MVDEAMVERLAIVVHCRDSDEHTLKWAKQPGKYRASIRRDVRDVVAAIQECGLSIGKRSEITAALADTGKAETETLPVAWTSQDQLNDARDSGLGYLYASEWKPGKADLPLYTHPIRSALVQPAPADAAVVEAWQPIETAPKDGTFILVHSPRPMRRTALVSWQGRDERAGWYGIDDCGLTFDAVSHGCVVTQWQHLPAPPALSSIPTSHTGEDGSSITTKGISDA